LLGQISYVNSCTRFESIGGGNYGKNAGWEERTTPEATIAPHRDGELKFAALEPVEQVTSGVLRQSHLDVGVPPPPLRQKAREDALDRHGRCSNPKRARPSALERSGAINPCLGASQEIPAPHHEIIALARQTDVAADTLEQPQPELGLEIANLAPQRRLGDVKAPSTLRETAGIGDGD
jgi:hypothetical protein